MVAALALMESPAIVIGLVLVRTFTRNSISKTFNIIVGIPLYLQIIKQLGIV
jgi:hypothetical protein